MRPIILGENIGRALALATVILVGALNIAVPLLSNHEFQSWRDRLVLSEVPLDFLLFSIGYIVAPAFIGYRVATAPPSSAVFPFALVTCAVVGFFLYAFVGSCNSHPQCNLYLALNIPFFWIGAFFCLFPKWSD